MPIKWKGINSTNMIKVRAYLQVTKNLQNIMSKGQPITVSMLCAKFPQNTFLYENFIKQNCSESSRHPKGKLGNWERLQANLDTMNVLHTWRVCCRFQMLKTVERKLNYLTAVH